MAPRVTSSLSFWSAAAIVILSAVAFFMSRQEIVLDVQAVTVTKGRVEHQIVATGTLQAVTMVDVGSQVSGTIQSLHADYNTIVHSGDVIARLDPSLYDAALREARAALAQARANVAQLQANERAARLTLDRTEPLARQHLVPPSDLDSARAALGVATADVKGGESLVVAAEQAVKSATVDLEHTVIRSPVDGVVLLRNVEVGQTLAATVASPVLYRIAVDLRALQLWVDVDEADVADVRAGEPAGFTVEAYGTEEFHGQVAQVRLQPVVQQTGTTTSTATTTAPSTQTPASTPSTQTPTSTPSTQTPTSTPSTQAPASTTGATAATTGQTPGGLATSATSVISYTAIVDVPNPDARLRPGMTATVILSGSHRDDALRVPNGALTFQPPPEANAIVTALEADGEPARGMREVWRYDHGLLKPVAVKAGLTGGGWTEIAGGTLQPGDEVATGVFARRTSALTRLVKKTLATSTP